MKLKEKVEFLINDLETIYAKHIAFLLCLSDEASR